MSRSLPNPVARFALAAGVLAMGVLALQYVVARPQDDALREFLVVTGLIAVSTAVVFGLVVPRALARGGSAPVALALSLLGLLLAAAYWSGLPPVLALGGVVLARRSASAEGSGMARAALWIGVAALVADLAALVADGVASS
jgi:hypothetical protein